MYECECKWNAFPYQNKMIDQKNWLFTIDTNLYYCYYHTKFHLWDEAKKTTQPNSLSVSINVKWVNIWTKWKKYYNMSSERAHMLRERSSHKSCLHDDLRTNKNPPYTYIKLNRTEPNRIETNRNHMKNKTDELKKNKNVIWLSHVQKRCDYYFDWKLFFFSRKLVDAHTIRCLYICVGYQTIRVYRQHENSTFSKMIQVFTY